MRQAQGFAHGRVDLGVVDDRPRIPQPLVSQEEPRRALRNGQRHELVGVTDSRVADFAVGIKNGDLPAGTARPD